MFFLMVQLVKYSHNFSLKVSKNIINRVLSYRLPPSHTSSPAVEEMHSQVKKIQDLTY